MTLFYVAAASAIAAWIITSFCFTKRIEKCHEELEISRMNTVRWETIALFHHGIILTHLNEEDDAWEVVRGYDPYRITIASFPCDDDPEAAKALAEELAEILETFHYYAHG